MWHSSFFTLSFYFFFFILIIPRENFSPVTGLSVDLVNTTCKQCADKSNVFNYDFCLTSLQPIPTSHVTNLKGLALIATELALENVTNTFWSIEKMLTSGQFDPYALGCLQDCFELYGDGVSMLVNSIRAFLHEQYDAANVLLSAVMETASTCEEGFKEKEGEVCPLAKENYNLFQLGDIALCIINLLSLALGPKSS
ncbi:putative invertase inhibitor [Actinidia eriantha]|uniref:putative invertase inhibitor n=1 Tax=Actinidia eriantha TaxID=165200 RepID=UPI00258B9730|nr:putative invertase inhibitor [Actinidia eriantha]